MNWHGYFFAGMAVGAILSWLVMAWLDTTGRRIILVNAISGIVFTACVMGTVIRAVYLCIT